MSDMKLLIIKAGSDDAKDVSNLVIDVKWSGRKGSAARSLTVNFIDDPGYGHDQTGITVERGIQCLFYWKGKELFRGLFMRHERSSKKVLTATAYDIGIYLSNNKDTFTYENATADEIFTDCCKRFSIPLGTVAKTNYKIPELSKPKTTLWDVICDALSLTYESTGVRYYPLVQSEKISLLERRKSILQWVIETGVNLEEWKIAKSIENIKTRVKLLSKEGKVLAEAVDTNLEKQIGIFQDIIDKKDDMNEAQLNQVVKTSLNENNQPTRKLTITARGLSDVITGIGVYIIIKEIGFSKTYYVEEDTHTFQGNNHTMTLSLAEATDISDDKSTSGSEGTIKVGDIVDFTGGNHYFSSTSTSPTGGARKAGKAKCTQIAKDAKHPYHLIGGEYCSIDGNSDVYGWVDASQIK